MKQHKGCRSVIDRKSLHRLVSSVVGSDEPINYLEFGVAAGDTLNMWLTMNLSEKSIFYGFDTFKGIPEQWGKHQKGTFSQFGLTPKIDDSRAHLIKGMFQETLPEFIAAYSSKKPVVVHMDADLYSSTLYCLTMLDQIMVSGTIIIFDEFYDLLHEFSAFNDYIRSYYRSYEVLASMKNFSKIAIRIL
ncbi:MAG: class I SAM-dependent methyltransferase, partial [Candidatus Omnitrophica bacterium]|nr:class I SAM-dependent methyltransferase [Candidatus Omnitrophota bacterium]